MKYLLLPILFFSFCGLYSQNAEVYPVFPECETVNYSASEACFNATLTEFVVERFQVPSALKEKKYNGQITVIFEVNRNGAFRVIYVDAAYESLKKEIERVFSLLPQIQPAMYNAEPTYMQFRLPINVPLESNLIQEVRSENITSVEAPVIAQEYKEDFTENELVKAANEYDSIESKIFTNPRYNSNINIPLSHEYYSRFDAALNQIGTNTHTASKPFLFKDVSEYYDLEGDSRRLFQDRKTLVGRKIWNEHMVRFEADDYWFTFDFALDLQLGKDFNDDSRDYTYNNTRAAIFQGGLGKNLNFYAVVYENQGQFAGYYNNWAESLRPAGGDPAIIPARGIAKPFGDNAYDYPVAEGYISYSPSKFFNVQFGHGKNFIGDGYRSLLMSDVASPFPYLKLDTEFWKLKYTNTWMSLRDVRPEVNDNGSFKTKFMANHYLSLNVTKRLNIGLFESVIWESDNDRGFDLNYLNPVIFYRAIEFSTGPNGGNALIGLTAKYKINNQLNAYGQWIIDEFSSSDIFGGKKSWKNKLGYQLGLKYFNAFDVPNLFLQLEYNQVRPYTYSHRKPVLNYGHANQSMAHLWGANFREIIAIGRYKKDRWYGMAKMIYGKRGFDYNSFEDPFSYGENIYRSYRERPFDDGVKIGQGNTGISLFGQLEAGYIINPETNLKLYGSFIYRNMNTDMNTVNNFDISTTWLNFGIRTDIFNWYYDY
ncbi:gliding motility protein RemB [Zunongwangia sp. HGR-M22]|uniref:gliding motility protein RemB n=1 Tax=Zunongwangia sp. HGR-M22 TaxID=3015168 RepID=UPI0022DD381B|nr:gliding motility protein RemB [Zunongwangia sp. HGR-M22]WBL26039.1 gliding motility protein RemB [Zunongwangia sp. HGR-M22]